MENYNDIPAELYADEAVGYIASRYGVASHEVVARFLVQSGAHPCAVADVYGFRLEENEVEIIRDLIAAYQSERERMLKYI